MQRLGSKNGAFRLRLGAFRRHLAALGRFLAVLSAYKNRLNSRPNFSDFPGLALGARPDQSPAPGQQNIDISPETVVFVWEACIFAHSGLSVPGK